MSEMPGPKMGMIGWVDLTVSDATGLLPFYEQVAGWKPSPLSMGDYDDYLMGVEGSDMPSAGICHARGSNAAIPPQWIVYITVYDLDARLKLVESLGGKIIVKPDDPTQPGIAIVQDPAGAVFGLYQAG